jgi:hypothetical protein
MVVALFTRVTEPRGISRIGATAGLAQLNVKRGLRDHDRSF